MADLPTLLVASLDPSSRKEAENKLTTYSLQENFLSHLLSSLILDSSQNYNVRLAGSVFFKNVIKKRWSAVSILVSYTIFRRVTFTTMMTPFITGIGGSTHL
jgi:hypothetical protein